MNVDNNSALGDEVIGHKIKKVIENSKLVNQTINKIASLLVNYISRGVHRRKGLRGITWQSSGGGGAGSNKCDKLAWGGSREEEWWGEEASKKGEMKFLARVECSKSLLFCQLDPWLVDEGEGEVCFSTLKTNISCDLLS